MSSQYRHSLLDGPMLAELALGFSHASNDHYKMRLIVVCPRGPLECEFCHVSADLMEQVGESKGKDVSVAFQPVSGGLMISRMKLRKRSDFNLNAAFGCGVRGGIAVIPCSK